jgi:ubiquitin thioesterase OTU1
VTLRCRGPAGQCTLTLARGTVGELVSQAAERVGVPPGRLTLLAGFPPRPLELGAPEAHVHTVGLRCGDSVQAVEASGGAASASQPAASSSAAAAAALPQAVAAAPPPAAAAAAAAGAAPGPGRPPDAVLFSDDSGFAVQRRIIASDNSCLFSAVSYVMSQSRSGAAELRRVIADVVAADSEGDFNEAFLGKSNAEYCRWIQQPDSWGGAIELAVLSKRFGKEICAADIQTKRIDRYGEGQYSERVFLLYDGIHYDTLAVAVFPDAPEELDVTVHPVDSPNAAALDDAVARLVAAAHAAKAFTDTQGFTLRCIVCREGMRGQAAAAAHAKATGHTSYGEYA